MRLEFIGHPGPWRNIEEFIKRVRFKQPNISEWELMKVIHHGNAKHRPRNARQVFHLFGRDIMSDDLTQIDVWAFVTPQWRNLVPKFPIHTGELLDVAHDANKLELAMAAKQFELVNRGSLISPFGLSRTYVWAPETNWIQDVRDRDVDLIRQNPFTYPLFRPIDLAEGPQRVESYTLPVVDQTQTTIRDAGVFAVEEGIGYERPD